MKIMRFVFIASLTLLSCLLIAQTEYSISDNLVLEELCGEISNKSLDSFKEIPQVKFEGQDGREIERIAILPIKDDINEKLYNLLKSKLTKTRYSFYERKEIEQLMKEQGIQSNDYYSKEGRLRIGQLSQWKGIIFGELNHRSEFNYGKKKVFLDFNVSMDNLETGQIIWSEKITAYTKLALPIHFFIIGIFLIFLIVVTLNRMSKGTFTSKLLGSGFLLVLFYSIWFWIV